MSAMETPDLLSVCLEAFVAVLGLLAVLAAALRGLIELFPEKQPSVDAPMAAAIASAAHAALPGSRVTHIEEIR